MSARQSYLTESFMRRVIPFIKSFSILLILFLSSAPMALGNELGDVRFKLSNNVVDLTIHIKDGILSSEKLELSPGSITVGGHLTTVVTDGGYSIDLFWTDWSAPGKINNADDEVQISQKDFRYVGSQREDSADGGKQLKLYFKGINLPFELEASYKLDPGAFYVHRRISIRDTVAGLHFLNRVWALDAALIGPQEVVKEGGFGQPISLLDPHGGSSFWGLEYPASENKIHEEKDAIHIKCGEDFGEKIGHSWLRTDWVVEGVAPNRYAKLWFMEYVKRIRVAPAEPYTLYNTWYDLRSPRFHNLSPDHVMNETNTLRIIDLIRRNMIDKHGITLNAFVLDDGWDEYQSNWKLRDSTFPHGLAPIVSDLKESNTALGLWLGPAGGYSFSNLRVDWMRDHGYETVGSELCLAGKNYSQLFRKRVVDFAKDESVGYYKWDGIQFSCSEPDHGHPVGIYSRRAILDTLISICNTVRMANPNAYLNITSGTWLSPWWVKYANQIWMQGQDYGYADVPSLSPRDAAMTYRDFVLYDDFEIDHMWFPIANLMTHGIIKGSLEELGGENEPLDKFTNESVLYFARGISMWELYISPDIMSEEEWNAISQSIKWAKDRFPIISQTEMVGGDPTRRKPYGYVHFKGSKGIVAARNPWIEPSRLVVNFSQSVGLDPSSKDLVVERVYPDRWISPRLYSVGQKLEISLSSYETAVYEIFPLRSANEPLLADVVFEKTEDDDTAYAIDCYDAGTDLKILNPAKILSIKSAGAQVSSLNAVKTLRMHTPPVTVSKIIKGNERPLSVSFELTVDKSVKETNLAILLEPAATLRISKMPGVILNIDGTQSILTQVLSDSRSKWFPASMGPGKHVVQIRLSAPADSSMWTGKASVWVLCKQMLPDRRLAFRLKKPFRESPMPPRSLPSNESETSVKILEQNITSTSN
ncbi:MAG TPA: hypothetical protein VIS48_02845 [Candidatus Kryptonia bacterium]